MKKRKEHILNVGYGKNYKYVKLTYFWKYVIFSYTLIPCERCSAFLLQRMEKNRF